MGFLYFFVLLLSIPGAFQLFKLLLPDKYLEREIPQLLTMCYCALMAYVAHDMLRAKEVRDFTEEHYYEFRAFCHNIDDESLFAEPPEGEYEPYP